MSQFDVLRDALYSALHSTDIPFREDKAEEGWILVEDVPEFEVPVDCESVPFFESGRRSISGKEILRRAKENGANFGQRHAERILLHQPGILERISRAWRRPPWWRRWLAADQLLIFPGTIWYVIGRGYMIPCLFRDGPSWRLTFQDLSGIYISNCRLLRPRSCAKP